MDMPQDDGSVKRNALQRLRDSFVNANADGQALRGALNRSSPIFGQIEDGAVQGGVMPVASGVAESEALAKAVKGRLMTPNMGNGAIIKDAAQPLINEAQTMAANAKPRVDARQLLKAIQEKFGNKLVQ